MVESTDRELVISCDSLTVQYHVYEDRPVSAARLLGLSRRATITTALENISFDLRKGEVLGLIGHNGAGKSTLIQAIAGAVSPVQGTMLVRGSPQVLGLKGFLNPKLSGHRNIRLGLLALGAHPSELDDLIPDVAETAGLGDFLQSPVRTYSSGMRARLNFAIATSRVPDILLLDEALAVGDRGFRRESMSRIRRLQRSAGAIVLASHNMKWVRSISTRVMWLRNGECVKLGDPDEVVRAYERSGAS